MNVYALAPLIAFSALVQSTVTSHVRVLGASPDLVLLLAVACVLRWGLQRSLPVILVGGLTIDVLTGAPFGCATTMLIAVSVLISVVDLYAPRQALLWPVAAIAMATLVYMALWMVAMRLTGHTVLWGPMLWRAVLPSVLCNVLTMPILLLILRRWWRRPSVEAVV